MAEVKGHCDPAFEAVREALAKNIADGEDLGACVCVDYDGRRVVDIWAGYRDNDKKVEWEENTIVNVWSCSKTVTNLAVLMCHDRGLLNVDEPIAKYWPEFAENGKEKVLVRNILSHSTGVSGWEEPISYEDVCDPSKSAPLLAKQAPWWEPGTASGYHAINQGHLAGELVRRTSGKSLKQFIAEEIAGPLGADFQLGAVEKDWPRISTLLPPPPLTQSVGADPVDMKSVAMKTLANPPMNALWALNPEWRGGEVGAANGHGNARSLVRVLSTISRGGEVDGVKLLSQKTIDLIFKPQTDGVDLVLGKPLKFGIGYGLANETVPWIKEGTMCFWGGWGGSSIIMDVENKLTFSYVMNRMAEGTVGSPRTISYINAAFGSLNKLKAKDDV